MEKTNKPFNIDKAIKELKRQNKIIWGFNLFMLIQIIIVLILIFGYGY